jgi:acetyl esterase/lipase
MKLHRLILPALFLGGTFAGHAQQAEPTAAPQASDAAAKVDTLPPGLPKVHPLEFKDLIYRHISDQDLKLDVYENPNATADKPAPVVVYWHGGAWWKGQRPASYGGFRALLGMGFSVVSVDYRLTGVALAPAAVQDVRCSLAWVSKNAAQYHFDTTRIVAYGTSAGGHLALMAGFLPPGNTIDPPDCGPVPKIAAVMDFYGIPDVYGVVASGIPLSKSTVRWIGGTGANDPASLAMARQMSPNTYLRPGLPPVFIAHGETDPVVPYQQSLDLKAALEKLHVPVAMYSVPNGVHGQFPPDQMLQIYEALEKFFLANHIIAR